MQGSKDRPINGEKCNILCTSRTLGSNINSFRLASPILLSMPLVFDIQTDTVYPRSNAGAIRILSAPVLDVRHDRQALSQPEFVVYFCSVFRAFLCIRRLADKQAKSCEIIVESKRLK